MYQSIPKLESTKCRLQTESCRPSFSGLENNQWDYFCLVLIAWWKQWSAAVCSLYFVMTDSKTAHASPTQDARHLTFLKNFGQIPGYVGSLDGRMPHQLTLQKASKTPTHQRLFKNFPMRQTICSNVNMHPTKRNPISNQVSESCLTEVCSFQ